MMNEPTDNSFFLDLSGGEQFPLMRVPPSTGHEAAKGGQEVAHHRHATPYSGWNM